MNFIDLALVIGKTLIIADTHIGYEEALNKQGILVPRFQFGEIINRLENILKKVKPETIIINGDIKHEFGTISEQEWRLTLKLIDFLASHCKKLLLVKGNHDTILGPIAKKRNIEVVEHFIIKDKGKNKGKNILITHGDSLPEKKLLKNIHTIIIGHEHPAVSIREGPRSELYKCFLKGKWKGKALIVLPSFNLVHEGTDVMKEKLLSPFLQQDLSDFEVYVVSDKVYYFGRLRDILYESIYSLVFKYKNM